MKSREIRKTFLDFFGRRGHHFLPSSPVVPVNDQTLLFANAGMNQFKRIFLGTQNPPHPRVMNYQKCIRAGGKHNDLDDVGKDTYHHTYFEMLGNWSFGDYFKELAIPWSWEYLTKDLGLDAKRLHVTVFEGDFANNIAPDHEAAEIWKALGVSSGNIHNCGAKDNFWEMGNTGPCGPCTEIHYDRTPDLSGAALVGRGTDQMVELWNLVFIEFVRNEDQSLTPLPARHVDTGMGFERLCAILQGKNSNYDTDLFVPLFEAIQAATGFRPYAGRLHDKADTAYRVISDHIRALAFALADGAEIGNTGRDYVLRRILRRAVRYGRQHLGATGPFLHLLVPAVVEQSSDQFPELLRNTGATQGRIFDEEKAFLRMLGRGMKLFDQIAAKTEAAGATVIRGEDAFKLHDTIGLYIDITQQMAAERGLTVDVDGFEAAMHAASDVARQNAKRSSCAACNADLPVTDDSPKYGQAQIETTVRGWVIGTNLVREGTLGVGQSVALLLDRTNFYAEQGGQVGDIGIITGLAGTEVAFDVENTQRLGNSVLHFGKVRAGELTVATPVLLTPAAGRRGDVARNHTATHLLRHALNGILGAPANQAGSKIQKEKFTWDFNLDRPLSADEINQIERQVNAATVANYPITTHKLPISVARQLPCVQFMVDETYDEVVRVVEIGDGFSREFCGGTHLSGTGQVGFFMVIGEESVSRGVRRITCATGSYALAAYQKLAVHLRTAAAGLRCPMDEVPARLAALQAEIIDLKEKKAREDADGYEAVVDRLASHAELVNGRKLAATVLDPGSETLAGRVVDCLCSRLNNGVVVIGWAEEGRAQVMIGVSEVVAKLVPANLLAQRVAAALGGNGGGKATHARAGGRDPDRLAGAVAAAAEEARSRLAS